MRAEAYQKFHEFNLHIEQGMTALQELAKLKEVSAEDVRRYAEYFEELRTSASGYLGSVFADREERESGRLFGRRRRREMAEDPMHGGWLEEEREKKRLKELMKANRSRKKHRNKKSRSQKRRTLGTNQSSVAQPPPAVI